MLFGIPKECPDRERCQEKRVGLSPGGVRDLVEAGAAVIVESGAGAAAGFLDEVYRKAGAQVAYSSEEVFGRADVVVKIAAPTPREIMLLRPEACVLAFWHMAVLWDTVQEQLQKARVTAIGYEVIQEEDGVLPILRVSSEIAGMLAPQIAGRLLETEFGGIGILLAGAPGIPPADVVIVGGGTLGFYAARAFLGLCCGVHVLDISKKRLELLDRYFEGRVVTALATKENVEKFVSFADVVVGAVLHPGEVAPIVVTQEMVRKMRPGRAILDFSYDQGGCVETTRLQGPSGGIFVREGVLHFAVPNSPSLVARSATHAQTHAILPYVLDLQAKGTAKAIKDNASLKSGCYVYQGHVVRQGFGPSVINLDELLA
ncbi:MAG: alanine dehydrogenase [Acidobacteria bacterium]|jgi:alanine dehydrogenase|nr:alanine dehydrogenase [Acidobacteriota bacterium]